MGKTRHEKSFVDFDKPYEQNLIGLRGVIYFGVGLFLLCVVTFGLMWALQNVMEDQAQERDRLNQRPMTLQGRERLPPEPRLQVAPGFEVQTDRGTVNLELQAPQSEYWVLREQWEREWENGQRVVGPNGQQTVVTLPLEEAKKRVLEQAQSQQTAAQAPPEGNIPEDAQYIPSVSSSGRMRTVAVRR